MRDEHNVFVHTVSVSICGGGGGDAAAVSVATRLAVVVELTVVRTVLVDWRHVVLVVMVAVEVMQAHDFVVLLGLLFARQAQRGLGRPEYVEYDADGQEVDEVAYADDQPVSVEFAHERRDEYQYGQVDEPDEAARAVVQVELLVFPEALRDTERLVFGRCCHVVVVVVVVALRCCRSSSLHVVVFAQTFVLFAAAPYFVLVVFVVVVVRKAL